MHLICKVFSQQRQSKSKPENTITKLKPEQKQPKEIDSSETPQTKTKMTVMRPFSFFLCFFWGGGSLMSQFSFFMF